MREPSSRLKDILEAISAIESELPIDVASLAKDRLRQVWFVHHLQIIGEAARAIPEDVRSLSPETPWRQWVGLRHIIVHDYFGVAVAPVYSAVTNDLEPLRVAVARLLIQLEAQEDPE